MKFTMKLPVAVEVTFAVETEDGDQAYRIVDVRYPIPTAFLRNLSANDAAVSIEAEIATRTARRRGVVE